MKLKTITKKRFDRFSETVSKKKTILLPIVLTETTCQHRSYEKEIMRKFYKNLEEKIYNI